MNYIPDIEALGFPYNQNYQNFLHVQKVNFVLSIVTCSTYDYTSYRFWIYINLINAYTVLKLRILLITSLLNFKVYAEDSVSE